MITFRACCHAWDDEKAWNGAPAHSADLAVLFSRPASLKRMPKSGLTQCPRQIGSKLKTSSQVWKVWHSTANREKDAATVSSPVIGLLR